MDSTPTSVSSSLIGTLDTHLVESSKTSRPRRGLANYDDEEQTCLVCGENFTRGQKIIWTYSSAPKAVHRRYCRMYYLAAVVNYYQLQAVDLVLKFDMGYRQAFRVTKIARESF